MAKPKLTRQEKAQALYNQGVRPQLIGPRTWEVIGSQAYEVREETDGSYFCDCPDALYRSHDGELCKHVLLVRLCEEAQAQVEQHKTCEACGQAHNLNAPYLYCDRDRAHYEHDRTACRSFAGSAHVVC